MNAIIEIYSHYFTVKNVEGRVKSAVYALANRFTQHSMVWDKALQRQVWRPVKTYGVYVAPGTEFRFHIGQLDYFFKELEAHRVHSSSYRIVYHDAPPSDDVELKIRDGWKLRGEQNNACQFIVEASSVDGVGNNRPMVMVRTGGGKAQPLHSLIKIPGGWVRMGDVQVGMDVVAWDGTVTKVTGVFPQGANRIYRLDTEDGRSPECDEKHLWRVYRTEETNQYEVLETLALMERLNDQSMYLEPIISENGPDVELHQDPYLFGRFVGQYKGDISYNILRPYLSGSHRQRCEVLRGILSRGAISFVDGVIHKSVEKALPQATAISKLFVRSLGGKYLVKSDGWDEIYLRKPGDVIPKFGNKEYKFRIKISRIVFNGNGRTQCISVDHPDRLYVTDGYVVTHNTVISLFAASKLGKRLAIAILPAYIEKWVIDLKKIYDIEDRDICVVQGSDLLQRVSTFPSSGLPIPKVFIISISTLNSWYKIYEKNPEDPTLEAYDCMPYDFFGHLRFGTVLFDEVHQHPLSVFKVNTYMNVAKSINLSATLLTEEQTLKRLQSAMFPLSMRFDKVEAPLYISCLACSYQIAGFGSSGLKFMMRGRNSYSHVEYEKSILRHKKIRNQYLEMIAELFHEAYEEKYMEGDRGVIYVSTIAMAEALVALLRKKHPNRVVRTYVEKDPLSNIIESDICVSTIISAGTALDIPNLRAVVMTISIDSPNSNVQVLGRLRQLPDRDTRFYYFYCSNISKQVDYHLNKIDLFKGRVLSHGDRQQATLYG